MVQVEATEPMPIICECVKPEYGDAQSEGGSMLGSNAMTDTDTPEEIERRMRAAIGKALHTPAKPREPSKAKGKESQSK